MHLSNGSIASASDALQLLQNGSLSHGIVRQIEAVRTYAKRGNQARTLWRHYGQPSLSLLGMYGRAFEEEADQFHICDLHRNSDGMHPHYGTSASKMIAIPIFERILSGVSSWDRT